MFKFNENENFACEFFEKNKKNNFSNDFFDVSNTSNVIINEWKTLILNNATIFESIDEMIARKHIYKHDATYNNKIIDNFVELIRSLLKKKLCDSNETKINYFWKIIFVLNKRKKNIMTRKLFVRFIEFEKKRYKIELW